MSSLTDPFFTPSALLCRCGKAHLERLNKMILCPVCGFYKVTKGGGGDIIVLKLKYEN